MGLQNENVLFGSFDEDGEYSLGSWRFEEDSLSVVPKSHSFHAVHGLGRDGLSLIQVQADRRGKSEESFRP